MIQSFGVKKNDIAKWAGITSAVFSFAQSATAVPWGRASDHFGRKPTIIIGLLSTMLCFLAWGMSTSLPMAVFVRMIQGGGNGNVGIIRTMVAEMITDKELQPRAFSIMPLVWSLGSVFGPAFGGSFAKPADHYPGLFGNSTFFKAYPFALPNFIAAVFFLISMTTATLFLKETLQHKRHTEDWGLVIGKRLTRVLRRQPTANHRRPSFMDGEATAPLIPTKVSRRRRKAIIASKPSIKEVFTYQSSIGVIAYTFLALHSIAYDQVLPVFLNYDVQEHDGENTHLPFRFTGGFGLEHDRIGAIFTVYGIACGLIQFILFPPLCSWLGVQNCFRGCSIVFPFVYLITPYTVLIPDTRWRYVGLLSVMFVKAFAVIVGFPAMTILLTNSASSLRILGTLNGFATTFSALGRAVGPAMAGYAFTWGLDKGYIITSWWLLALISAIGIIPSWMLIDGDGPSLSADNSDDELEEADISGLHDSGIIVDESAVASGSEDDGDSSGDRQAQSAESPLLSDRARR